MIRGTAYTLAALIASKIVLVVNSIAISRLLGSQHLGVLAILWSVMALAGVLAMWGIPSAVVKFTSERGESDPERASEVVTAGTLVIFVAAGATAGGVVLLSSVLASSVFMEPALAWLLPMGAVALIVSSLPAATIALLQGFQRIRELNLRSIVLSLVSAPVTIVLVWQSALLGAAVAGILVAFANLAVNLGVVHGIWKKVGLRWRLPQERSLWRALVRYGSASVLISLAVSFAMLAANTSLVTSTSYRELGYFTVALALAGYLSFIPSAIGTPMVPAVSEAYGSHPEGVATFVTKTVRLVSAVVPPLAIVLQVFADPIVVLLYGSGFAPAVRLVPYLAASGYMLSFTAIVGFALLGTNRVWHGVVFNLLWAATYSALAWFLAPSMGASGLAAAYSVAYLGHFLIALTYALWVFRVRSPDVAPLLCLALAGVGMGVVLPGLVHDATLWLTGAAWIAVVVSLEWRLLNKGERDIFRSILRRFRPRHRAHRD